jgi:hypothetical protein
MIGREAEVKIMNRLLNSNQSEMLAMIGRRRIGKTYLINQTYQHHKVFDFTGTQYAEKDTQLEKFSTKLSAYYTTSPQLKTPKTWFEAFEMLKTYLKSKNRTSKKRVVFLDELPWIDTHRSGFLAELSYWWNDWAVHQNIVLVLCGSAASWMIKKIVNHKGGLHNRVTQLISLQPFTLAETKSFLLSQRIKMTEYQILQLYMVTGGVPYYLNYVLPTETAEQTINRLCFTKTGMLNNEFKNLYAALFDNPENHITVIRKLAEKRSGLTRSQLSTLTDISPGGGLTKVLEELEASSFIAAIQPLHKKKKDTLYRLADEYSHFYLKYIEDQKLGAKDIWHKLAHSQSYKSWCGYAFENICIKHTDAIQAALGIQGVYTETSSYLHKKSNEYAGFQIDMLIDRADNAINICEIKYYADDIYVTESMATTLRKRRETFRSLTNTKKQLLNTIITTYGVNENEYSKDQIDQVITAKDLFELKSF